MIKTAALFSTLTRTIAPRLLQLSQASINPMTAKAVGAIGTGLVGGVVGANSAAPGNKAKGFLVGAATGAGLGFYGGKTIAGMGAGGVDSKRIFDLGNKMKDLAAKPGMTNSQFFSGVGEHVGQNWANADHLANIPKNAIEGPAHRPMLGIKTKNPIAVVPKEEGSSFTRALGNMSRSVMGITSGKFGVEGSNFVTRTGNVLKKEFNEARHYTKLDEASGKTFKYKRSLTGQALGVTLGSGIGAGVFEGSGATNNDGTPASLPKKLFKGTSSALSWGLATPIMGAKAFAYDIPKYIINPEG